MLDLNDYPIHSTTLAKPKKTKVCSLQRLGKERFDFEKI